MQGGLEGQKQKATYGLVSDIKATYGLVSALPCFSSAKKVARGQATRPQPQGIPARKIKINKKRNDGVGFLSNLI